MNPVSLPEALLPVIPLRDMVVFPHCMSPFVVGRSSSMDALKAALSADKRIFLVMQKDASVRDPEPQDLCETGTVATIVQSFQVTNGNYKVLVEGNARGRIEDVQRSGSHVLARVRVFEEPAPTGADLDVVKRRTLALFEEYIRYSPNLPLDSILATVKVPEIGRFTDLVLGHLQISPGEKQKLLETVHPVDRLFRVEDLLQTEITKMRVDRRIQRRVKKQMERTQKEYYLNEKMKAIQRELGRGGERANEVEEFEKRIKSARLPKEAEDKATQELHRLEVMPPVSAEATVSRNYLEWLLAVPWNKKTREIKDIERAERILDEDHYGLEKVKERILEFLAVRQMVKNMRGSILCFVGPPGVGKTSLARSIARATGRRFVRLSLGGVRDEAEIRGHRRTYIGAYPGRIIQMMRKAGTVNPIFLLDEIDKMAMDFRGDPSAALLEVLDPEQNTAFLDHYIDTEYDLSQVMFITTANVLHTIPAPLQDRMEVIRLSGYTLYEKIAIAQRFLVPKQLKAHGLLQEKVTFDEDAIRTVIERYTSESGVRNLEREIASICRKIVRRVLRDGPGAISEVRAEDVLRYLKTPRYRVDRAMDRPEIGLVNGLAWTEMGGQILTAEATLVRGRGALTLTGKLGEVMQESAKTALTYVHSRGPQVGIEEDAWRRHDIHIHVPEGAIPKDGPSAGITMATAIASILTRIPVKSDLAMTGEITLRGKVLPIGGVKEKLLAAYRAGIRRIILSRENEKDMDDIPRDILEQMEVLFVEETDEVLRLALVEDPFAREVLRSKPVPPDATAVTPPGPVPH